MNDIKVLLTAVGHPTSPGIVSSLKNNGERNLKVVGVDSDPSGIIAKFFDSFYKVPCFSDHQYLDKILKICESESVDVYYPRREEELLLSNQRKKEFLKIGTKLIVPGSEEMLKISCNKINFHRFFKKHGIPYAQFRIIKKVDEIEKYVKELGFPLYDVFLKPAFSVGGRGAIIIKEHVTYDPSYRFDGIQTATLKTVLDMFSNYKKNTFPELIAMEFLPGKYYSVDVLSSNGNPFYIIPKIRIQGTPSNTMIGKIDLNPSVIELAKNVCKS